MYGLVVKNSSRYYDETIESEMRSLSDQTGNKLIGSF